LTIPNFEKGGIKTADKKQKVLAEVEKAGKPVRPGDMVRCFYAPAD